MTNLTKEEYRKKIVREFPEYLQSLIYCYEPFVGKIKTKDKVLITFADCKRKGYCDASFLIEQDGKIVVRLLYTKSSELENQDTPAKLAKVQEEIAQVIKHYNFKWEESHEYGTLTSWWDLVIEEETWNEDGFLELWKLINKFERLTICPKLKCENSVCEFCE